MKRKNIVRFIILPLLLMIAVVAGYIYKEYNRAHKDTAQLKPDYSILANDFLKEFASNQEISNKKYWDKVVAVHGIIKEISHDENGNYTIALGDTSSPSSVRCSIDSTHSSEATFLLKGNTATVKGICSGFNADELLGSDIILFRCVVDPEKFISNN